MNLISKENFLKDVAINPDELDEIWMLQPQIFEKYAENFAAMMQKRDNFKIELDALKSKKMKEIIDDPPKFGLKKTTDAVITAVLNEQEDYIAKLKEYNQINHDYNVSKDRKDALKQKKDTLENMVKLFGLNYFAGPMVPRKLESGERFMDKENSTKNVEARKTYNANKRRI